MSMIIEKIHLQNFKRFRNYTVEPNEGVNILVGDNEVGKSTILEAIDIVSSGSVRRVESIGLDKLMSTSARNEFLAGTERKFDSLPVMLVELYLKETGDFKLNGTNNSDKKMCDGFRMICKPNPDYEDDIIVSLKNNGDYFPYEYYSFSFSTFADLPYNAYKEKMHSVVVNSDNLVSEYATNDFIRRMYIQNTENDVKERAVHNSIYRQMREDFCSENFKALNERVQRESDRQYTFGLKSGAAMTLDGDLMIYEDGVGLDCRGTGEQVFIKTDFALKRAGENIDVVLMEEPENHLSPVRLRSLIKLVQNVSESHRGQLFMATHSSVICARLEINNLLIMQTSNQSRPIRLKDLDPDTADYFKKSPAAGIVEFALARKAILVEGPSEYMLMERFYGDYVGHDPEIDGVNIINVRGLSFKRYLEIAKLTDCKVAVITDNDHDYQSNCVEKYDEFSRLQKIKVFSEKNPSMWTFEVNLYRYNKELCDKLFEAHSDSENYMILNKTEAAYVLLNQEEHINVPKYIEEAFDWIKIKE